MRPDVFYPPAGWGASAVYTTAYLSKLSPWQGGFAKAFPARILEKDNGVYKPTAFVTCSVDDEKPEKLRVCLASEEEGVYAITGLTVEAVSRGEKRVLELDLPVQVLFFDPGNM